MKIIGHRGARGLAPENTLDGLQAGLDNGADMIEFDVRVTDKGIPVLHHDPLPKNHAGLPTLASALERFESKMPLYIEVKPQEPTEPICKVIMQHLNEGNLTLHNFYLGSKSQQTLHELHEVFPEVDKIVIEPLHAWRAARRARELGTKYIAINQRSLRIPGSLQWLVRSGFIVYPYTVNSPGQARRFLQLGAAGIVTDYPDRFAQT